MTINERHEIIEQLEHIECFGTPLLSKFENNAQCIRCIRGLMKKNLITKFGPRLTLTEDGSKFLGNFHLELEAFYAEQNLI